MEAAVISVKEVSSYRVFQRKNYQDSAADYRKRSICRRPQVVNPEAWIHARRGEQ